ncbi:FecR family protein [Pseudofulvibacter geojedonensis]|uniref:FecR family protein n=1 Tax=Pseudofulvibacter geojedonensis TaxID=1123758 RepID=A0ABW3I456_9FLAO
MKQQYDDTFLARWASGELTTNELAEFKASSAYSEYKMILDGVAHLEAPSYNQEANFKATLAKIERQKEKQEVKVRRLIPNWAYAAAACLVLFLGAMFMFQETSYSTDLAQQNTIELPDGSIAQLNADSKITHKKYNWGRSLELEGEAFFKVKKGSTFSVTTKEGTVTVLGTEFTVNSRNKFYQVICYEGKVQVIAGNEKQVLTPGKAFNIQQNKTNLLNISEQNPSWIAQESSFTSIAILQVVEELERQYGISIKGKENLKNAKFTGRFSHSNLKLALTTVFDTMEIPYTFDADQKVSIQKY